MGKYAGAIDCNDPLLRPTDGHLDEADSYVDGKLWGRGIDPASLTLPNRALTAIAVAFARYGAARDAVTTADSPMISRRDQYWREAERLSADLSAGALGIAVAGSTGGVGSFEFGRA